MQNPYGTRAAWLLAVPVPFTYRDLDAWKQAMDLVVDCYRLTARFPKPELYGLTSQLRRAALSIPANIAEGHSRRTTKAYLNHVSIAIGSQAELETDIELGRRLGYFTADESARLQVAARSVGRLLYGLHRALTRTVSGPDP